MVAAEGRVVALPRSFGYNALEENTTMGLMIAHEPVPLRATEDGVVRVGGTRVTLDTVVAAFEQGATAEEIIQQYPSLNLADAYAVIGYYLRHRSEVEAYLARRGEDSRRVRHENETRFDSTGVRARQLARRSGPFNGAGGVRQADRRSPDDGPQVGPSTPSSPDRPDR